MTFVTKIVGITISEVIRLKQMKQIIRKVH